jgi:hypothetical protein
VDPDLIAALSDLGVTDGLVLLLVLDRVRSIVRTASGKDGGRLNALMSELVAAVRLKNAVNIRLDNHDQEITRLRDAKHELSDHVQKLIGRLDHYSQHKTS